MLQFQVLTPTPSAPLRKSSLPVAPSTIPETTSRRDSAFLVLTPVERAAVPERRDSAFLVLSPVQSDSYPKAPVRSQPAPVILPASSELSISPGSSPLLSPTTASGAISEVPLAQRRRTSTSSSSSGDGKRRFLKLGPVHWGGEEGANDYALEE